MFTNKWIWIAFILLILIFGWGVFFRGCGLYGCYGCHSSRGYGGHTYRSAGGRFSSGGGYHYGK